MWFPLISFSFPTIFGAMGTAAGDDGNMGPDGTGTTTDPSSNPRIGALGGGGGGPPQCPPSPG